MIEPNVISYFLIILCGFGAVWSFRYLTGKNDKKMSEFEYAGFSTLWGSLIFFPILLWIAFADFPPEVWRSISNFPFMITPSLFIVGASVGAIVAGLYNKVPIWMKSFKGMYLAILVKVKKYRKK